MSKTFKGETKLGFKFEISERRLNNYELLELIGEVDEGQGQVFPKVVKLLFGDEQAKAFKDHLREEDGIVPNDKMADEIKSVFAFVGRSVPAGAVETAPPIFGLAAVTFDADAVVIFFPPVDSAFGVLTSVSSNSGAKTTPPF